MANIKILGCDIETYSSAPLPKCGVYRYADAPDFEILLFSYAYDDEPVITIDMANGERLPEDVLSALDDPQIIKMAYNAQFERVCISKHLGHWLDPAQWRCTAVMASYLTLPARLGDVAVALGVTEKKMEEGKDLIRYFSVPCKATKANDGRTRNLPKHAPDKWEVYKQYNAQDVQTERAVRKALEAYPLPEHEWALYALDQRINDRGVRVDRLLVKQAMSVDQAFSAQAFQRAKDLTGLENPGSVTQLKVWLADQDMPMESMAKKIVQEKAKDANGIVGELLNLRLELSKTSVKKYEAMARTVCRDGRVHGLLQFGGASRTMRWAGRLVQAQNLPQNHLPDLALAREIVKTGDTDKLEMLFGSVPNTLSELIRTAFIPKDGCRFIVADFSAIEARVLAWLAGEEWVLEEFRGRGKIYEATAARMFHVPAETIVKGHENYLYRQKGKQAVLSCGYGGGVGALKAMGAKMPEEEMQPLVDAWRAANPHIVGFWGALDRAAREVIEEHTSARVGKLTLFWRDDRMFIQLPAGRRLCYISPRFVPNRFGNSGIGYLAPAANGQLVIQETFGGKLVENCIAQGTPVITNVGLVPIEKIEASHLIWDGEAFVHHGGLLFKGIQETIRASTIRMTPEHQILTEEGWIPCGESDGLNWATVSLPDGFTPGGFAHKRRTPLACAMCLRQGVRGGCWRHHPQTLSNQVLRMPAWKSDPRIKKDTRHEPTSRIWCMAFDETAVRGPESSCIPQLWRARYFGLSRVVGKFRELLERYGADISFRTGFGSHQQQQGLQPSELSMGGAEDQCQESSCVSYHRYSFRANDSIRAVRENRNWRDNNAVQAGSRLANRISVCKTRCPQPVYDIRNCGSRHRFAVWDNGKARIVSNCTQSIARDLLAHGMMNLEAAGYPIVFHVHDEAVMEMPIGKGSVEEACEVMARAPAWAAGLPLRADGDEMSFYQKT